MRAARSTDWIVPRVRPVLVLASLFGIIESTSRV
jgi:hypothetical protein